RAKSATSVSARDSATWYCSDRSTSPPSPSSSKRTLRASSRARWRRPISAAPRRWGVALRVLGEPHVADKDVDLAHFEAEHLVDRVRYLPLHLSRHRRDVGGMLDDHEQLQVQRVIAHIDAHALVGVTGRKHPVAIPSPSRVHPYDALH